MSSTSSSSRGTTTLLFVLAVTLMVGALIASSLLDYTHIRSSFVQTHYETRKREKELFSSAIDLPTRNTPHDFECHTSFCSLYTDAPDGAALITQEDCETLTQSQNTATPYTGILSPLSCRLLSSKAPPLFRTRGNLIVENLHHKGTQTIVALGRVEISTLRIEANTFTIISGGPIKINNLLIQEGGTLQVVSREPITLSEIRGRGTIHRFPSQRTSLRPFTLPQGLVVYSLDEPQSEN